MIKLLLKGVVWLKKTQASRRRTGVKASQSKIPGIRFHEDGSMGFSPEDLPASTHFFDATHYLVDTNGENCIILFGQKSIFSKDDRYNAALEISMPRRFANLYLKKAVFDEVSLGSKEPLMKTINGYYNALTKQDGHDMNSTLKLPDNSNSFRRFSANYVILSISEGQAVLEFFELPPDIIANLVHGKPLRMGSTVHSVISVLANISIIKNFFDDINKVSF